MDKKALQELYLAYLTDEGYKGEVDEDGDIAFKYEGGLYFIMIDGDDENYFRIMFPTFWEIENDNEKARALEAANMVNSEYKYGKVVFREGSDGHKDMCANAEVFLNDPNDFKPLFLGMLSLLQDMVDSFGEKMKKGEE